MHYVLPSEEWEIIGRHRWTYQSPANDTIPKQRKAHLKGYSFVCGMDIFVET